MNGPDTPEPAAPASPHAAPRPVGLTLGFLRDLFDLRFRKPIAVRMLPGVYGLGIGVSALFTIYLVFLGFKDSFLEGMVWLLLLGPVLFIGLVTALRIILEFVLAFFRMAWYVEHVAGHTEEMRKDMPKFGWWRTLLFGESSEPPGPKS